MSSSFGGGSGSGPAGRPIAELVVPYDPGPTRARIERFRRLFRSRLISLGITLVLLIVIGIWQHRNLGNPVVIAGYVLVVALAVAFVLVTLALWRRSRRPLATLAEGSALRIDRRGVALAGQGAPWPQVIALAVRRGPWGLSPDLELTRRDGPPVRLPLDQIGTFPATIDSVARAYSGGRHGVDLSALDT